MGEKVYRRPQNGRSQQVGFLIVPFTILQVIIVLKSSIHAVFRGYEDSRVHEFPGSKNGLLHPNLQRYKFVLRKARGGEKELGVRS